MKNCFVSFRIVGAALAPIVLALFQIGAPEQAQADDVVCAEVMPCNVDGTVFPPYDVGACSEHYRDVCEENQILILNSKIAALESKYNICVNSLAALAGSTGNPSLIVKPGKKKKKDNKEKKVIKTDF